MLLYHHWKFALAALLAMSIYLGWSSRAAFIAMSVLAVMLAMSGKSVRAQTVVDGDTIKLNGTTYRLWGIDAPESKQACADGWMAGQAATSALRALLEGATIECEPRA